MQGVNVTLFVTGTPGGKLNKGKRKVAKNRTRVEREGRKASRANRRAIISVAKRAQNMGRNK